jgi:hypothetical protein
MSTLRHVLDLAHPFLGGIATGQRQLELDRRFQQDAADNSFRQQAFANQLDQQNIRNDQWNQGFQLDQQRFDHGVWQDEINNHQQDQDAFYRQQLMDQERGQQLADQTANASEWERYNPPPMSRTPGAFEQWEQNKTQFAQASPQTQQAFLRRMQERQDQHEKQKKVDFEAARAQRGEAELRRLGLDKAMTPETRAQIEMAIAAKQADVSLPSSVYSGMTDQSQFPNMSPQQVAGIYGVDMSVAGPMSQAINSGAFGKTAPRVGIGGRAERQPVFGSMTLDVKGRDGTLSKVSVSRGSGQFASDEVLESFRDIASTLEQPSQPAAGQWNPFVTNSPAETPEAYQKRIDKRARQLAAQAGWRVNGASVSGGVVPGGAPGENYAAPMGGDNIDQIINQLTPEQIQAILDGG